MPRVIGLIVGLALLHSAAHADMPLFRYTENLNIGGPHVEPSAYVYVAYTDEIALNPPPTASNALFAEAPRSAADVGKVFTETSGSPAFADFADKITDGMEMVNGHYELISFSIENGAGEDAFEAHYIFRTPSLEVPHTIDLHGDTISRLTLSIDQFDFRTPPGESVPYIFATVTLTCYGSGPVVGVIPEPSTLGSLGCCLLAVRRRRARRANRTSSFGVGN